MKPIDYAKALGVAPQVLILDVLIAMGVVCLYLALVNPGRPKVDYGTVGIRRPVCPPASSGLRFGLARLCYAGAAVLIATHMSLR